MHIFENKKLGKRTSEQNQEHRKEIKIGTEINEI